MKKRTILCLFLCVLAAFALISCAGDDTVPEGMQVCRDSDALGVTLYAPEGWTVCNVGDISAAYVSSINQTSISLTEADMGEAEDFVSYFDAHKGEFAYEITLTSAGNEVTLGNADSAASFVYTFTYAERHFKTLQVLALYGERFYIFTYTSYDEAYEDDKTYYEQYYDYAKQVMETVVFRAKGDAEAAPTYEADEDGYLLVSDKMINGFFFYMPPTWTCDVDEGILQVKGADGVSVNLSEATGTGVSVKQYFMTRMEELSVFVDDLTVYVGGEPLPYPTDEQTQNSDAYKDMIVLADFGNAKQAAVCEYAYTYAGETYHVLQYLAIAGNHGYVFTYTAPTSVYAEHLSEAQTIAEKVRFS